jgi:putative ABC transport system permease protein
MSIAILRDLRFAIHSLRRSPGFTLIAVVTLALGIGANTAMFSVLNGYMLRPTPYADSGRLDRIFRTTAQDPRGGVSPADYRDLEAAIGGYGTVAAYANWDVSLAEPGKPAEVAQGIRASANLFSTLGTEPRLGRAFRPGEETLGNHRVLVISNRYWQVRFGGDPQIVGRTVRVDGEPYEIVGVLPEKFSDWRHLSWVDVFRPLGFDEKEARDRSATWLRLVGRRASTVAGTEGNAIIAGFGRGLAKEFPAIHAESGWHTVPIDESFLPRDGRYMMMMLVGLSAMVLLIACSNLANLLLARTIARAREFALRSALGASRARVLRPLFVESILVAFAGGAGAMFVARWTFDWLAVASAGDNGVGVELALDWNVLAWAFGACVFTALAFGVVPALFVQRLDLNSTLKSGSRGSTGDRRHRRFRNALIVGQFALAMVLLAGAALFVRGLHELNNRRHGWESDHLVTGTIVFPTTSYESDEEIVELQRLALQRLAALPGVSSVSVSYAMPFFGLGEPRKYLVAGRDVPRAGQEPTALINGVSPDYFQTVGTRVLSGRTFAARDDRAAPKVFVINDAMARGLFRGENPIGRRLAQAGGKTVEWGEIVGVVADVESVYPERSVVTYQLYQPMAQEPRRSNEIAVRTAGVAPSAVVDSMRKTMMALDPDLPVRKLQPAEQTIARANYQLGVLRTLLTSLALLGLGLAILGTYGVVARTTAQRTSEFGIRLAVGAQAGDIVRLVLTSGAKLALVGSTLGLLGALGVSRLFAAAFPGMQTNSLPVLVGVTGGLIAMAQIACYLPARHASRVSLTQTLRAE